MDGIRRQSMGGSLLRAGMRHGGSTPGHNRGSDEGSTKPIIVGRGCNRPTNTPVQRAFLTAGVASPTMTRFQRWLDAGPNMSNQEAWMAAAIKAKGVVARVPNQPGVVEEFNVPAPRPGEARVRILASGVCHTDLSAKNGVFGTDGFPFLLGHEGAAVVERVGEGVTNVAPGDHVILAWRAPCGSCRFCLVGQPHLCAASLNAEKRMRTMDGVTLTPILGIGTFCTHTLVHSKQCIPYDPA